MILNSKFQIPNPDKRKIGPSRFRIWGFPQNEAGFTLIELIIVMAIIAILAGISIFTLGDARKSGRDAKRKTDLETIRAAIEIYRADCGLYPTTIPSPGSQLRATCTGVTNTYLESIPGDSLGGSYFYWSNGTSYRICACLEDATSSMSCAGFSCPAGRFVYRVGGL